METREISCPLTRGEKILVAVDGSVYSDFAVDQAVSLGGMCKSKIYLISVVEMYPEHVSEAVKFADNMIELASEYLEHAKQKVKAAGIPCETISHTGVRPYEFIIQEAKDKGIDLIIMGTHGRTGLKRLFLGSVAQKVVGYAHCPVMVIPCSETTGAERRKEESRGRMR